MTDSRNKKDLRDVAHGEAPYSTPPATSHALDIRITPGEVELFATSATVQLELLRRLRLLSLEQRRATILSSPDGQVLAACSAIGLVNVLVPVIVDAIADNAPADEFDIDVEPVDDDASLSLFRTVNCSFFVSTGDVVIQLERNGEVAMTFLQELPAGAAPIPEAEVTTTLLALAEAAESILAGAWSCGYYSLGQTLLWSSGDGVMYAWDPVARSLRRMSRPPAMARQLRADDLQSVPQELKQAVAALVARVRDRG